MELNNCCSSCSYSSSSSNTINKNHGKRGYERIISCSVLETGSNSKMSKWKLLWIKIKKEKRKIFDCSTPVHAPYDPYTYSQNFDQGSMWADPDNLSRSFSARFAVPSQILHKT
ncbi:hypothetical protein UlMin_018115 [Ulmus minor]